MGEETGPRVFLTRLLDSISSEPNTDNPLATAAENDRKLLLTLHVLFPNELLPALDLLDRHLVTRTSVRQSQDGEGTAANAPEDAVPHHRGSTIYHVRSAQQKTSSSRFHDPVASTYEIRLTAWNCSCPAFAFAAFPPAVDEGEEDVDSATEQVFGSLTDILVTTAGSAGAPGTADREAERGTWLFGGLTRDDGAVPACKHLLACVLAERCPMFRHFVGERELSLEEAAGWVAGWMG